MRLLLLFLPLLLALASQDQSDPPFRRGQSFKQLFSPADYAFKQAPVIQKTVYLSILLRRIDDIDEPRGTVTIDVVVFQGWDDLHQQADDDTNWDPLIEFSPVSRMTPSSHPIANISSEGKIQTRQSMSLVVRCDQKGSFPSDEFLCKLRISSPYKGEVRFQWSRDNGNIPLQNGREKVKVAAPFELSLLDITTKEETQNWNEGDYVMHPIYIGVRRRAAAYYWISSITPSIFLLVLTWSTLFLDREKFILLRIVLALVSLIAMQALNFVTNSAGRGTETGNVLVWWFQVASLIIFVVLIEDVIIVILITRRIAKSAEDLFHAERSRGDVEKVPAAMDYLTKVFFPIFAILVLIVVFIMI